MSKIPGGEVPVHTASELVLKLIRAVLGTVLLASVFLICANAFGRYVLHAPIIWSEEILGYILVWLVYLGAVLVTAEGQHLKMDLILQKLPPGLKRILRIAGDAVFIATGVLIIYQAPESIGQFTHRSQVAGLPMQVVHLAIPISFVLIVAFLLLRTVAELRRGAAGAATPGGPT